MAERDGPASPPISRNLACSGVRDLAQRRPVAELDERGSWCRFRFSHRRRRLASRGRENGFITSRPARGLVLALRGRRGGDWRSRATRTTRQGAKGIARAGTTHVARAGTTGVARAGTTHVTRAGTTGVARSGATGVATQRALAKAPTLAAPRERAGPLPRPPACAGDAQARGLEPERPRAATSSPRR